MIDIINKSKVFETELSWIVNEKIREFATKAISELPDYFFTTAASSTGKYHPSYALGDGGLVRHTKAATAIAHELLQLEMYGRYSQDEKDLIITAIILHDGRKHGINGSQYTVAEHPKVMAEWVRDSVYAKELLTPEQIEILYQGIISHMGQWNTDYRSKKEILPKPVTGIQKFIHQADYLASRKCLEFNFTDFYNPSDFEVSEAVDELQSKINLIIKLCTDLITNGEERDNIYRFISELNDGKKNPNSISSVEVADSILHKLEEFKS